MPLMGTASFLGPELFELVVLFASSPGSRSPCSCDSFSREIIAAEVPGAANIKEELQIQ